METSLAHGMRLTTVRQQGIFLPQLAEIHLLLDPYTRDHSYRVQEVAREIGQLLGLGFEELQRLGMAALYHDIGKIAINPAILLRPETLSPDELDEIRLHPEIGAALWQEFNPDRQIAQAILSHHEKYDGSGYPFGLTGADIPLWGRVIAVADALDAMMTRRTYNIPLDIEDALEKLFDDSGSHFDPLVVDALFNASFEEQFMVAPAVHIN